MAAAGEAEIQPAPLDGAWAPQVPSTQLKDAAMERHQLCGQRDGGSDALFTSAALLPALLASGCCIPQLMLTLCFGVGCMGFAALAPFR